MFESSPRALILAAAVIVGGCVVSIPDLNTNPGGDPKPDGGGPTSADAASSSGAGGGGGGGGGSGGMDAGAGLAFCPSSVAGSTDGLVGYYTFEGASEVERLKDHSAAANDGTENGPDKRPAPNTGMSLVKFSPSPCGDGDVLEILAPPPMDPPPVSDKNNYGNVVISEGPSLHMTGSYTIMAWARTVSGPKHQVIVSKSGLTTRKRGWELSVESDDKHPSQIRFNARVGVSCCQFVESQSDWIAEGGFHHVAGVYDNAGVASLKIYVDGKPATSGTPVFQSTCEMPPYCVILGSSKVPSVPFDDASANARIGLDPNNQNPFFGIIDEVRIYKRALTTTEIAAFVSPR